jgi:phospholipase A2-like protein
MIRRFGPAVGTSLFACLLVLTVAAPASAVTLDQRLGVISAWTQANVNSYNAWYNARRDRTHAEYQFDWSTDYCSQSPDQPLGFDFRMPCARHDFPHRNYPTGFFAQNKWHVDNAFYFDLKEKCTTYSVWVRSSCYSLAWSYYQVISKLNGARVSNADLDKAARLKAQGVAAAAAAGQRA